VIRVPILLYHSVDDDPPAWIAPFTVSVRGFREQLDRVLAAGRVPVTAHRVLDALGGGAPLPENAILLTFDDGFHDFVRSALPELARRSLPAALFATTAPLRRVRSMLPPARMMTVAELAEAAAAGVEIGAHSHTHPQLDTVPPVHARAELAAGKDILEDALGERVDLLAYPHGYSNAAVRRLAREAGYRGAFAVRNALSSRLDDPYRIARLTVRADTPPERFERWLRGEGAPLASRRESAATTLWRVYRKSRARVRGPRPCPPPWSPPVDAAS
jgi:peptidoglycan/xylan/chitin deacetylase (PgdA/CDA1 family)